MTNSNNSLFSVQPKVVTPADSTFAKLQYAPNGVTGTAIVTVTLQDSGGTANGGQNSRPQTFVINVVSAGQLQFMRPATRSTRRTGP